MKYKMYPSDTLFIKQNQSTTFTFSSVLHRDRKQFHQKTISKWRYTRARTFIQENHTFSTVYLGQANIPELFRIGNQ